MTCIINLPSTGFRLLVPCFGDFNRSCLEGIHIDKHPVNGLNLVATNSHIMGIWHEKNAVVEGEIPESLIVKTQWPECLDRRDHDDEDYPALTINTHDKTMRVKNISIDVTFGDVLIDEIYPDWRNCVPSIEDALTESQHGEAINTKYLPLFRHVMRTVIDNVTVEDGALRIFFHKNANSPALCLMPKVPEFVGVLMPMRDNNKANWQVNHFNAVMGVQKS